ncbi:MAG: hypothetical protein KatS3mg027_0834 [Bacteroidia bacterium]|nr:MAG: hypothetical protein KatS3mg027_0834 [Bacteroidia bacterium]
MLVKKISYSIVTRGLVACINFLVLILTSRYFGVETRGQISLLILNIANVQMISEIFTGYALVHFIPKYSLKKIISTGILWIVIIVLLGTTILWQLNYLIPNYEIHFLIISLMVILNTFFMVIVLGKENIRLYNWLSVLQPMMLFTVLLFNIFIEKKLILDSYLDALFYSFGVALVINSFSIYQYLKKDTHTVFSMRDVLSNGFLSQWSNWMHLLSNRFSYYVLNVLSLQLLGKYSTASSLMESVFVIYSGVSTVVLSYVSNESDKKLSQKITIRAAMASFVLTMFAIFFILLIPERWIILLIGKGFEGIKMPMMILSIGASMISYSAVFSHYFSGIGVLKYNAMSNTIACLFTILFSHLLIQKFGMIGAAIVASVSYSVQACLIIYFFKRHEKIGWQELLDLSLKWNKMIFK